MSFDTESYIHTWESRVRRGGGGVRDVYREGSRDGAVYLSVPGRPTYFDKSRTGDYYAIDVGWECQDFFSRLSILFSLSLSLSLSLSRGRPEID